MQRTNEVVADKLILEPLDKPARAGKHTVATAIHGEGFWWFLSGFRAIGSTNAVGVPFSSVINSDIVRSIA